MFRIFLCGGAICFWIVGADIYNHNITYTYMNICRRTCLPVSIVSLALATTNLDYPCIFVSPFHLPNCPRVPPYSEVTNIKSRDTFDLDVCLPLFLRCRPSQFPVTRIRTIECAHLLHPTAHTIGQSVSPRDQPVYLLTASLTQGLTSMAWPWRSGRLMLTSVTSQLNSHAFHLIVWHRFGPSILQP